MPMSALDDHVEHCPECKGLAIRDLSIPGMIKVSDGASPTRTGSSGYRTRENGSDQGFQREFNDMFFESRGGEPLRSQFTDEPYVTLDNEGGRGRYLGLQSDADKTKRQMDYEEHK